MTSDATFALGVLGESDGTNMWRVRGDYINRAMGMIPVVNGEATSLTTGEVGVYSNVLGNANEFKYTTTAGDLRPVLVVPHAITATTLVADTKTILTGETGFVYGPGSKTVALVNCDTGAIAVGSYLKTSSTAGKATSAGATAAAGTPPPVGAFAIATSAKNPGSAGTVSAILLGGTATGVGGKAYSSASPAFSQGYVWDGSQFGLKEMGFHVPQAKVTASNTNSLTDLISQSIAASTMGANGRYRIEFWLDVTNNTGGAVNHTVNVKLGATTIFAVTTNTGSNASPIRYRYQIEVVNNNSESVQEARMIVHNTAALANSQTTGASAGATLFANTASENTATTLTTEVEVQMGTASANMSFVAHGITMIGPIYKA